VRAAAHHRGEILLAGPVVAETAWFIESRLGPSAEAEFLRLVPTQISRYENGRITPSAAVVKLTETSTSRPTTRPSRTPPARASARPRPRWQSAGDGR